MNPPPATTAVRAGAPAPPAALHLHVPDEPELRRAAWREQLAAGEPRDAVLGADGAVADWLWSRWAVLAGAGMDRAAFGAQVHAYRRELWLWLHGDRTWEQCCAGLVGRLHRRLDAALAGTGGA